MKLNKINSESYCKFVDYVTEFYNSDDGIYPIANSAQIIIAINQYLSMIKPSEFYGDSVDREKVRELLVS